MKKYLIYSYKHDGSIHRYWKYAYKVFEDNNHLVLFTNHCEVYEKDGTTWTTRDLALFCFFKEEWYNVICMLKENTTVYYCNLASPYIVDNESIKFIDYDLDIKVVNNNYKVLDEMEYFNHRLLMNYPQEIDTIMNWQIKQLKTNIIKQKDPFNQDYINTMLRRINDEDNL